MDNDYSAKMKNEIRHYEKIFKNRMSQEVPPVWLKVEKYFADCIEKVTGVCNLYQYVARHVKGKSAVSILGLGSGTCGNELDGIAPLLKQQGCTINLTCLDINEAILDQALIESEKRGVHFIPMVQDVNKIKLDFEEYDIIVAYASLHHFIELEHIAKEINKSLKKDGIFVTVDIPTRNGYKMWDNTYEVVKSIWRVLPPKYKITQSGFFGSAFEEEFKNIDYSVNSFECINSEAILPALRKHLKEIHFVPSLSIARRFFDTKFGYNYDLTDAMDLSIFDFIITQLSQLTKPQAYAALRSSRSCIKPGSFSMNAVKI